MDLVDAQQARRIVDRLVGYTLSPLLSKKVRNGLSAGRVQSVAVRLVVEREREIQAFTAREYWTIEALLETEKGDRFAAEVIRHDGAALEVGDADAAERHRAAIAELRPAVSKVATRTQKRSPAPPFTTSTLQQEASRRLGYSPRRTMSIAQRLYEGVETPEGHVGLITYMRTDSTAMAGIAMGEARDVIGERYGAPYTMAKGRVYKTRSKGAQEAHESIRPTSFRRDPDSVASSIKPDELRLYRLIWQRALASQMAPKELETTTIELSDGGYDLRASATKVLFDGFARVYTEGRDDATGDDDEETARLPALAEGDRTRVEEVTPTQHFTEPPPRYTEATLIKALEEHGIGRPSTYAATISTITERGYVRVEERRLHPEPVAEVVTDLLVEHFGDYVDLEFTARMEEELDEGRARRARLGAVAARLLRTASRASRREAPRAATPGLHDRADRRGLLRGSPDGHPARAERALPGLLHVPRAQGDASAAGRGATRTRRDGRGLPEVRRGDARRPAWQVRSLRRLLALPGLRLHQARGPAAARPAAVRGDVPEEPRRPPRPAASAPDGQRLLGLLELSTLRFHDQS
jgi:DNA topoisomerase-1